MPTELKSGPQRLTTRYRLQTLLRLNARTVEELAAALDVTDNAVRFHLDALQREGTVQRLGSRKHPGVGQPAAVYALTQDAETAYSRAYAPVLAACVSELRHSLPRADLVDLLHRIGQRIAAGLPRRTGSLASRVRAASDLLNSLGGITTVVRRKDGYHIVGHSCPLAVAVDADACSCAAVTSLVSHVVRARVTEKCNRSPKPACCFVVGAEWDRSADGAQASDRNA